MTCGIPDCRCEPVSVFVFRLSKIAIPLCAEHTEVGMEIAAEEEIEMVPLYLAGQRPNVNHLFRGFVNDSGGARD